MDANRNVRSKKKRTLGKHIEKLRKSGESSSLVEDLEVFERNKVRFGA
jgi:hypothetical protein